MTTITLRIKIMAMEEKLIGLSRDEIFMYGQERYDDELNELRILKEMLESREDK